jgi:hypothetical protein
MKRAKESTIRAVAVGRKKAGKSSVEYFQYASSITSNPIWTNIKCELYLIKE